MINVRRYRWPLISVFLIIGVLLLMIAIGYSIGVLSDNPDGLERVLIDNNGESWLESLPSPWIPLLSWIESDYFAGTVGIIISVCLMTIIFYLINSRKNRTKKI
jgi:uncharacterized membrane protein